MRRLVGVGLAVAALVMVAAPAGATGPGKNGKLVYRDGSGIVVADAGGTNPTTVVPGSAYAPVWSPDGLRFVVEIGGDIWSYDAAGGNAIHVTSGAPYDETPAWSPDATKVVFGRSLGDREAIFVANAAGTGTPKQLSHPAAGFYDFSPAWSPNGRSIAFNRDKNHGQKSYDIWVMKSNGTNPKGWLDDNVFNGYPAWSPDSKRIAYEQKVGSVIVLRTRALTGGPAKTVVNVTAYEPEYSPDGTRLLYMNASGGISSVPVGGGTRKQLVASGGAPSWQPACNKATPGSGGTITGTAKAELLCGGAGPDTVHSGGGDDHVFTFGDADTLDGDAGNDTLVGGDADDTFNGGAGNDACVQGAGSGTKTACER